MAGYNGYSKSNNAVYAEGEGKLPLTRAVAELARMSGITQDKARHILKNENPCEWHHTSKHYNTTFYYDVCEIAERVDLNDALSDYIKPAKKDSGLVYKRGTVYWDEWHGTRRHGRYVRTKIDDALLEYSGSMVRIYDKEGVFVDRKLSTGKRFSAVHPLPTTQRSFRSQLTRRKNNAKNN